ncbi:uncharacterized protein AB675_6485 [Cyphellophora attinorum]|uniref:Uncharacterized protein n=1 Tax=Cyphellophora attinorum TaxID=1664694 RepID=A0A0N1H9G5_9EURO|nr:uncharacterized protein AB675_6485 [Phialophora attinorum]KPI44126.1 hypothetical protein AB675_6485 [Phialophora attinorum]
MVLQTFPSTSAHPLIISLYQTLFREAEFMHEKDQRSELEKVVQKPVLAKVFSFHYGISYLLTKAPSLEPRNPIPLSTQWAWIVANLRLVAQLMYISIREVSPPIAKPSPEFLDMICGNIKWTLDLIRWIAASVIETSDRETNPDFFDPLLTHTNSPPMDRRASLPYSSTATGRDSSSSPSYVHACPL